MRGFRLIPIIWVAVLTACDGEQAPRERPRDNQPAEAPAAPGAATNGVASQPPQVSGTGKTPTANASPRSRGGYRLIGTEPFWGGTLADGELLYTTPENQVGESVAVELRFESGQEIYSGRLEEQPFILVLTDGPCSDGMSDNIHAFTARLEVKGETRQGCANPQ
jgi:uncharacterized membrane protein